MSTLGSLDVGARSALLFDWHARDLSLNARTGQAGTFSRADSQNIVGGTIDRNGRLGTVLPGQPRWIAVDLDGDGVRESFALLHEPQGNNLVKQSNTFATSPWSTTGTTPTNAVGVWAGLSFCRFGGANASATSQSLAGSTFTGNGVKSGCIALRYDGQTGSTFHSLRDTTASADRAVIHATWSSNGVPAIAISPGTVVAVVSIGDGVWLVFFQTASVTAANAHSVFPNNGSGFSGTATSVLASAMMLSDTVLPTSPIVTTTTPLTRLAEALTWPCGFAPQAMTLYAKYVEYAPEALVSEEHRILRISSSGSSAISVVQASSGSFQLQANGPDSSSSVSVAVSNPNYGDVVELCGSWTADQSTVPSGAALSVSVCINGGAITTATAANGSRLPASFTDPTIEINHLTAEDSQRPHAFLIARAAPGALSLLQMRGY